MVMEAYTHPIMDGLKVERANECNQMNVTKRVSK